MPFNIFKDKKQASRKFIDLIHAQSTKWANWDPSRPIKPGDFGVIVKDSGLLEVHGSIFTEEETKEVAKHYPACHGDAKDIEQVISKNAKGHDLDIGPYLNITGMAKASIKTQLEFEKSRGAVLIMYRPQTLYITGELLHKLERGGFECLKGMSVVTDVYTCSSYVKYLSAARKENVKIALLAEANVNPVLSAGSDCTVGWWGADYSGIFEKAHDLAKNFFPLYIAKNLKSGVTRDHPLSSDSELSFVPTLVPWNRLDDDGKEIVFAFDDSEDED